MPQGRCALPLPSMQHPHLQPAVLASAQGDHWCGLCTFWSLLEAEVSLFEAEQNRTKSQTAEKSSQRLLDVKVAETVASRRHGSLQLASNNTQLACTRLPQVLRRKLCASTGCTGKRSRTGFVPLAEFDERALLSDYRFLEEAAAASHAAQRAAPGRRHARPPPHLQELVHQVGPPTSQGLRNARGPPEATLRRPASVCAHLQIVRSAWRPRSAALRPTLCAALEGASVPGRPPFCLAEIDGTILS